MPKRFCFTVAALIAFGPAPAVAHCVSGSAASPSPAPEASAEPPLYSMTDDIFTVDHDATLNYYFQSNADGSARARREMRYDQSLSSTCAQLQLRVPFFTRYPAAPNAYSPDADPYSGLGNVELRYSYNVPSLTFDHSVVAAVAFGTATHGVESNDTQLEFYYATKWKWDDGALAYVSEYDQTIIRPPGAGYTSYYEGKLTLPSYAFIDSPALRGVKISAIFNYRFLFNDGGLYQSAAGGVINGDLNDIALDVVDTWGIGQHGMWRYRIEATAAARF